MMNIKYIFLLPLMLLAANLQAQTPDAAHQDIVYLKNGTIIRGTIIESFAHSHIRIRNLEGKVYEFNMSQVRKKRIGSKVDIPVRKSGYFNESSFGLLIGMGSRNYWESNTVPSIQSINGFKFNYHYQLGLGTGIEFWGGDVVVPLFADLRYNFLKKDVSPFIALQSGYGFNTRKNDGDEYGYGRFSGGYTGGLQIGLRNYVKANLGYSLSMGYRYQRSKRTYDQAFYNGQDLIYVPVEELSEMHRFTLRIGILFN